MHDESTATPADPASRRDRWRLAGLVLLAFILRAGIAWRTPYVYPDGAQYLRYAEAWRQGDVPTAVGKLHLNLYPLLLAGLGDLGLEPESAGKWWGVAVATLALLPLWGWLHRQFGKPAAWAGAILYATHPRLVAWSPEIVRDPTFWLAALVCLWLARRAIDRGSSRDFAWAVVAALVAAYTRVEGIFLCVPLAWWSVAARTQIPLPRFIATGSACLAIWVAGLVALNLTVLRELPRWEFGDGAHVRWATVWAGAVAERVKSFVVAQDAAARNPAPVAAPLPHHIVKPLPAVRPLPSQRTLSPRAMYWALKSAFFDGFTRPLLLATLLGALASVRTLWRAGYAPLVLMQLAVLAGICTVLRWDQALTHRYTLFIVILALPCAAVPLGSLAMRAGVWLDGRCAAFVARRLTMGAAVALLCVPAMATWRDIDADRAPRVEIGRWLAREFGPHRRTAGSKNLHRLVGYYARVDFLSIPDWYDGPQMEALLRQIGPEIVVLWNNAQRNSDHAHVLSAAGSLGLTPLPAAALPEPCRQMLVLVSHDLAAQHKLRVAGKDRSNGPERSALASP